MNPEITKIIEQYLNNELSESDKAVFEQRLRENASLREEVDLQKSIHEGAKRAAQRSIVKQTGKSYHFRKNLLTTSVIIGITAAIAVATYVAVKQSGEEKKGIPAEAYTALLDKLDNMVSLPAVPAEYFELSKADTVILSRNGVLLSVPEGAFLLNGKSYSGMKVIQWQEAVDAATIVKGGLSTVSGNNLLETQGMFGIRAFTPEGKKLEVNPEVGVYVQVPVDELKEGMQLFEGKPKANGVIDWQNPKPLEKKPVMANMKDLDFYPPGYEAELNKQKWKTGKKSRDSLYLSLEDFDESSKIIISSEFFAVESDPNSDTTPSNYEKNNSSGLSGSQLFHQKCATCHRAHKDGTGPKLSGVREKWIAEGAREESIYSWINNWSKAAQNDPYCLKVSKIKPTAMNTFPDLSLEDIDAIFDYVDGIADDNHIPPASVLGFWNPKFNKTLLSTRDFEKRMIAVHKTCNEEVLKQYTGNPGKPMYEIDERVAAMGYPEFCKFAAERVGAVKMSDPHMKNLQAFYEKTIAQLTEKAKTDRDFVRKLEAEYDSKINQSRTSENNRKAVRNSQNYSEELGLNYTDCLRQLGKTRKPVVGFTITGGAPVYNLDRFVAEMTTNRTSGSFYDKETGKTAKIQYNSFSVSVNKPEQFEKLFLYLFPHELNSFQRIDPEKTGFFDYPLNNIIQYDLAVIGINEENYHIYTQKGLNKGSLGVVKLEKVSEKEFNRQIEKLNSGRNSSPVKISEELKWLSEEKKDYKVQRLRKEMQVFRAQLKGIVFPCGWFGEEYGPADDITPGNAIDF